MHTPTTFFHFKSIWPSNKTTKHSTARRCVGCIGYGKFNAHFLCSTCLCVYVFTFYLCIADIFSFIYVKGDHFGILYKTEHQVKMLNKNSKKLFHSMYSKYSFFFCALVVECLSLLAVTLNKLKWTVTTTRAIITVQESEINKYGEENTFYDIFRALNEVETMINF